MKGSVRINDINHGLSISVRQSGTVARIERRLNTEIVVHHVVVNPNEPNNEDEK
jgi:hypothetical protein